VFWNWIKPFKPGGLLSTQRYVLVGAFIAAAMITPTPDVLNQCLIAVPIVGIYQLGVVAVYFMNRKRRNRDAKRTVVSTSHRERKPVRNIPGPYQPPVSALKPVNVVATKPDEPKPAPVTIRRKPASSLDGFTRTRPASLDVPSREQVSLRPQLARPQPMRPQQSPQLRRQTSIDGFTFV
jgi:hypothetical protein